MSTARRNFALVMAAAALCGCGIRDVRLDEELSEVGGASGMSGTHVAGASGKPATSAGGTGQVGGAALTAGAPNTSGGAISGIAGTGTSTTAGVAGTANGTKPNSNAGAAGSSATKPRGIKVVATNVSGTVCKSANYTLILSVGEAPGGNREMASTNYQLYSGFVGVSQ